MAILVTLARVVFSNGWPRRATPTIGTRSGADAIVHGISLLSKPFTTCFLSATSLSRNFLTQESCIGIEIRLGNIAGAHRIKSNVVEILLKIFLVADYVVEKSGLP